jgi:hypothetical protein
MYPIMKHSKLLIIVKPEFRKCKTSLTITINNPRINVLNKVLSAIKIIISNTYKKFNTIEL